MTPEEVIRRLRRLKEPAKLFGETEEERAARLERAEREVSITDEAAGGQQANFNIEYARQQRKRARGEEKPVEAPAPAEPSGAALDPEQEALMAAFRAAAEEHAAASLPLEDALARQLRRWCADWEADLEARSEQVKASPAGHQATQRFHETAEYLKPLFSRLRNRSLDPEMLAGLKMIVDAMKGRNYLHAYKIYMGIAIGNSPWPIGVTQVGLHERSAREKISFKSSMSTVSGSEREGDGVRPNHWVNNCSSGVVRTLSNAVYIRCHCDLNAPQSHTNPPTGAHHERRGDPQVYPGAEAADDLLPAAVPDRPLALRRL